MQTSRWSETYPRRRVYSTGVNGGWRILGLVRHGRRTKGQPRTWSAYVYKRNDRYIIEKGFPCAESAQGWCDLNWASL